ncbi:OmpA/MotB family protein [Cellvibrio polysaccharolyticus]|uniref:OmpA family protein n=1 Tax=Cellvibrio polysaccharolyticus TaxID=2082724 RepID=A0A928YVL6_9GAMM|nr:OmpA family protein [Cellvibrio polysaccharolyticus]MBE8717208.1 OmpA family protein [Cellvibrio polysaccharolyticus]
MEIFKNETHQEDDSHWLSVSDLMSCLMIVFLFIAITLMRHAFIERDKIKQVAVAYQENQVAIYQDLKKEFEPDLNKWNADIDEDTLTFTFKSPDVLFKVGESHLSDQYKHLLTDFFPRYMSVLEQYKSSINEVRIEGHTSSQWNSNSSERDAYFHYMDLSQGRTRSVLSFVHDLETSAAHKDWIKSKFAAVGFSSSKLILDEKNIEDSVKSRRVSFRVVTNAEIQIKRILEATE